MKRYYLDANATYEILPAVKESLVALLDGPRSFSYLNGSSIHAEGQKVRALIDAARADLYRYVRLREADFQIVFTSGATEGNNTALLVPFEMSSAKDSLKPEYAGHVISTSVEHSSVEEGLQRLERAGVEVTRVRPGSDDIISPDAVLRELRPETKLVSMIWANNETGVIHPIPEIFRAIQRASPNCILHTDAVQALSKLELDLSSFPFDFLTIAPHKFGALPGIGISIVNKRLPLKPLAVGGAQELKWRPGTENVVGIVSIQAALAELSKLITRYREVITPLRAEFEERVLAHYPTIEVIGKDAPRLPNTVMMRLPGILTEDLVVALDLAGVSCSRGSACSSGKQLGSHVIGGMNYPKEAGREVLRLSFPANFQESDLETVLERLFQCFERFGLRTKASHSDTIPASVH
ncbi:MAG: cysteine desulfurase [Bdellovibrionales bacterium]|nr:cysteine desulfurase [Bdellovibrionales bacterium]